MIRLKHLRRKLFMLVTIAFTIALIMPRLQTFIAKTILEHDKSQTLEELRQNTNKLDLTISMANLRDITGMTNIVFWYYDEAFTEKAFLASAEAMPEANKTTSIANSSFYSMLLLHHKYDLCYITRLSELAQQPDIAKHLLSYDLDNSGAFYIACPVHVQGRLFGYISGLFEHSTNGVVGNKNLIKTLTKAIGEELSLP